MGVRESCPERTPWPYPAGILGRQYPGRGTPSWIVDGPGWPADMPP